MEFPTDKNAILKFVEQSNRPDQRAARYCLMYEIFEREYQNVSEVAEAAKVVT